MGKAIQCPACGRKHRVAVLPDAPTFRCESCGQPLKVPAQFRPSVMASSRHVRPPDSSRAEATAVQPPRPARAAAPVAASAPAAPRPPRTSRPPASVVPRSDAVALPLRVLAWAVALPLGLIVTLWLARVTGWLSGDRLVDVFTETGWERYIRVVATAPVWALFATLFLTLFLEGGRALARRRAEKLAETDGSRRGARRDEPEPFDRGADAGGDGGAADRRRTRRAAARRGGL
jgi:hypothetical protein